MYCKWLVRKFTIIVLLVNGVMSLYADAVVTKSGRVFLGKIQSKSAQQTEILAYGKRESFSTDEIEITSTTIAGLAGRRLYFTLTDGSTIQGKLRDFSEDIGIYVESEIGSITIPYIKIAQIDSQKLEEILAPQTQNPQPRTLPLQVGIFGSASYSVISESMRQGFGGGASGETPVALKYLSGLGIAGNFETISAQQNTLRFSETAIYLYARKTTFPFAGLSGSALKRIGFAITAGLGGAYMHLTDSRTSSLAPNGEAYGLAILKAGAEFPVWRTLSVRFDIINAFRFISGKNLWKPGLELGVMYAF